MLIGRKAMISHSFWPGLPPPEGLGYPQDSGRLSQTVGILPDPGTQTCLLAEAFKESGAWLSALPVSSLGLRMEDDVIQVAVGLHLGVALCAPHYCCHCRVGSTWQPWTSWTLQQRLSLLQPSMISSRGLLMLQRSAAIWNLQVSIDRIASDQMELQLFLGRVESTGVGHHLPRHTGNFILSLATREPGAVTNEAEKKAKCARLETSHNYIPVAMESFGVFGRGARSIRQDLSRHLEDSTSEPLSYNYHIQRILGARGQYGCHARHFDTGPHFGACFSLRSVPYS